VPTDAEIEPRTVATVALATTRLDVIRGFTDLFENLSVNSLKVPKREIFDGSDFPDFHTIKSLRMGDFGVKIKKCLKNI
jgi:hypothetical protein